MVHSMAGSPANVGDISEIPSYCMVHGGIAFADVECTAIKKSE